MTSVVGLVSAGLPTLGGARVNHQPVVAATPMSNIGTIASNATRERVRVMSGSVRVAWLISPSDCWATLGSTLSTNASTRRAMFLSVNSPIGSNARSSRPCTWSRTLRDTQMPPTGHAASRRAAMFTPSPCRSVPCGMTSPMLMPTRKRMRRSGGWSPWYTETCCCTFDRATHRAVDAVERDE